MDRGAPVIMSFLSPLLEVQELDLAADAARKRSENLPERTLLPRLVAEGAAIETRLAAARSDRMAREAEEAELGRAVSQIARDIESAEVERYSGKRFDQDEAKAHEQSQTRLHEKQAALEEEEMRLLEAIEAIEVRIEAEEAARVANRAEVAKAEEAIREVEAEVAIELERLLETRQAICAGIPKDVMAAYERVRGQNQKAGRGAAVLVEGRCGGCRIKLPSLEKTRMMAEPESALIQCPQCRRVLVR